MQELTIKYQSGEWYSVHIDGQLYAKDLVSEVEAERIILDLLLWAIETESFNMMLIGKIGNC